jgi:DNA-binding transcriptional LysR family regulator
MDMDRHLAMETFIRVVDTGSFSAAANQMKVGQPAVSKAIAQLEEWLGVRLLLRSTRSLTPTEAGMNFYVRAKRSIEEAEEAVLAARGAGAALSGKLRISASVCFGRLHIMRQLDRFLEKHPELEIDMVLDDPPINLVEEGIDVAFRSGSLADSTLVARKIGQARRLVGYPNLLYETRRTQKSGRADRASDCHLHSGWRRPFLDVPPRLDRDFGGWQREARSHRGGGIAGGGVCPPRHCHYI